MQARAILSTPFWILCLHTITPQTNSHIFTNSSHFFPSTFGVSHFFFIFWIFLFWNWVSPSHIFFCYFGYFFGRFKKVKGERKRKKKTPGWELNARTTNGGRKKTHFCAQTRTRDNRTKQWKHIKTGRKHRVSESSNLQVVQMTKKDSRNDKRSKQERTTKSNHWFYLSNNKGRKNERSKQDKERYEQIVRTQDKKKEKTGKSS